MSTAHPLKPENWGEDDYIVGSKGHHDPHQFMAAVRAAGYSWPLGNPQHVWLRSVPHPSRGTLYVNAKPGVRGAWPATVAYEAYGEELYQEPSKEDQAQ